MMRTFGEEHFEDEEASNAVAGVWCGAYWVYEGCSKGSGETDEEMGSWRLVRCRARSIGRWLQYLEATHKIYGGRVVCVEGRETT